MNAFGLIGHVEGISRNGSVIVGRGVPPMFAPHAYRFTASDAHVEDLGALKQEDTGIGINPTNGQPDMSVALGVSEDGNVVVGTSGYAPPTDAFIWTPATKIVKLSDYLKARASPVLRTAADTVSPDGKIIAGTGVNNTAGRVEGFVVRLP